ncbi:hypothetical protein ACLBWP_05900 [Microbacterium sp. M1A1_1b]
MTVEDDIAALTAALRAALPGSTTSLRGSRAAGTADRYSDVDLAWEVGAQGDAGSEAIPRALTSVGTVESVRLDPDSGATRRLVFARIAEWSLFQRIDLELRGTFAATPSWVTPWSPAESALMNVIAAVKATARGMGDIDGLLARAADRIGLGQRDGPARDLMRQVVERAVCVDPMQASLGARVSALITSD